MISSIKRAIAWPMLAVAAFSASAASAQGYQVQPMLTDIPPSGAQSTVRLAIKNTGSVPITLEMEPFRATVSDAGVTTRTPEEKDLLVFPPQTVVQPGKEQAVQVRYIGDAALNEARIYGVRVSQLPIDFGGATSESGAKADVKMGINFLSHIVVSPPGARSSVKVADVAGRPDGSVGMTVRNDGNAVVLLSDVTWKVQDGSGKSVELAPDKVVVGEFAALLPNQSRTASIPAAALPGMSQPFQVTPQAR